MIFLPVVILAISPWAVINWKAPHIIAKAVMGMAIFMIKSIIFRMSSPKLLAPMGFPIETAPITEGTRIPARINNFKYLPIIYYITVFEKFTSGGWVTLIITSGVISLCYLTRRHYTDVGKRIRELDEMLLDLPTANPPNQEPVDPQKRTAVLLVADFNGYGVHTLFSILRNFPDLYKNVIFISIAVVDSGSFKGVKELEALKESSRSSLVKYVDLARRLGFAADYRLDIGIDVVESATGLCESVAEEFPKSTFFTGQLIFQPLNLFHKLLHNETAFAIQRRLEWKGMTTVILPVRVRSR